VSLSCGCADQSVAPSFSRVLDWSVVKLWRDPLDSRKRYRVRALDGLQHNHFKLDQTCSLCCRPITSSITNQVLSDTFFQGIKQLQ